jgi:MFS family permease
MIIDGCLDTPSQTKEEPMVKRFGWWSKEVGAAMAPGVISSVNFGLSTALLPFLMHKGYDLGIAGWIVGVIFLSSLFGNQVGGILKDRCGAKFVAVMAMLVEGVGFIGYGFGDSPTSFFLARVVHGFGFGLGATPAAILLREALRGKSEAEAERGKAHGKTIALLASGVAAFLSPILVDIDRMWFSLLAGVSCILCGLCLAVINRLEPDVLLVHNQTEFTVKQLVEWRSARLSLTGVGPISAYAIFTGIVPIFVGGKVAGLVTAVVLVANGFFGSVVVSLRDKWKDKLVVLASRVATLLSVPFLLFHQGLLTVLTAGILVGFGIRANSSTLYEQDQQNAPPEKKGVSSASFTMASSLVSWLAVSTSGMIVDVGGYAALWWVVAALSVVSIIEGIRKKNTEHRV